jgi:hypothetical protein
MPILALESDGNDHDSFSLPARRRTFDGIKRRLATGLLSTPSSIEDDSAHLVKSF